MIIDTHTHFYDPTRSKGVPWPDSNDDVLYRPVYPKHHKALAIPEGVTGTVVVEASTWVEDNQWILDLAESEPFIVGFVGNLDIGSSDFEQNLERYSANLIFRGVRLRGVDIGEVVGSGNLTNVEMLAAKDLSVDLLSPPDALPSVAALAAQIPELRIVINHVAGVSIDGKTPDAGWVEGMQMAASNDHVYCKVSGLVENTQDKPSPTDVAYYAPTVDVLWDAFGADRLVYGSNWPVSERFADYATVQRIVSQYFNMKGVVAAEKYFWRNATAAYKWLDRG